MTLILNCAAHSDTPAIYRSTFGPLSSTISIVGIGIGGLNQDEALGEDGFGEQFWIMTEALGR